MPLPEEWDNVNWDGTVVLLPETTEGLPVFPINSMKYPKYPRGYFMAASTNDKGQEVIGYNAADVGTHGRQVSEFVFWHELGHHRLGHTKSPQSQNVMDGISFMDFGFNNETAADIFSCQHWGTTGYGITVIFETYKHFIKQGNAPGDAEHPAPAERAANLLKYLKSLQFAKLTIKNDSTTRPEFVKEILMQCLDLTELEAWQAIKVIEKKGAIEVYSKGLNRRARYLTQAEAAKIVQFVLVKKKFSDPVNANFTCIAESPI
jgi:ATP-dependent Clp protease adapter protein ClpS